MNLDRYTSVFFIGIGGIGMAALVEYFLAQKKQIGGYDLTPSDLTKSFEERGAQVFYREDLEGLQSNFKDPDQCLVVYTPAVPVSNAWMQFYEKAGFSLNKRSQVLGMITENTKCFAVAGTHGKTTTSSMLAHIISESDLRFTAFLGGISNHFKSNYFSNGFENSVVEADEYDRSFLRLHPDIACITSTDADHLDIYGTATDLQKSFLDFASLLPSKDQLVVYNQVEFPFGRTYGEGDADFEILNLRFEELHCYFDLKVEGQHYKNILLPMPGRHNVYNAVAAFAMAYLGGLEPDQIIRSLAGFKGVARRFSIECKQPDFVFIDDYAHHPTAIKAIYEAVNDAFPALEKTLVFQPHLFSRTRDFMEEFAASISLFDSVVLLPIYPARELPLEGVNSEVLLEKISATDKVLLKKEQLVEHLKKCPLKVLVTLGAGDIGLEVEPIKKALC
jgi:UDP-N-acetylmuramate--alanine ligase